MTARTLALLLALLVGPSLVRAEELDVGSKKFTESVVLGELVARVLEHAGEQVGHRRELGGTQVLWKALVRGELDVYPEYTGTIQEEILGSGRRLDAVELRRELALRGVRMSRPLGFNNTYALGLKKDLAARLGLERISQLREHPELRFGFTNEFMDRPDGWPGLRDHYGLPQRDVRGLDHDLAYRGLASGDLDLVDLYSTDADIRYYDLAVLEDDKGHFPVYDAVLLYRQDLEQRAPRAVQALLTLQGAIDAPQMVALNARAKIGFRISVPDQGVNMFRAHDQ